jgi:hypothetical protein
MEKNIFKAQLENAKQVFDEADKTRKQILKEISGRKWKLALKVLPLVGVVLVLKLLAHHFHWEFLTLNSLFTALISANIFLIGFLITGVMADYKESEKIPGEMAASLETLLDEGLIIAKAKNSPIADAYIKYVKELADSMLNWLCRKERTKVLMDKLTGLNDHFSAFEGLTQANFIARLKQEQNALRKMVIRVHYIRETSFNPAGYAIAEIITFLLCAGLILVKMDPFYESIFFVFFVSFILIYMVWLIKDLDNPFGYFEDESLSAEVSLKSLMDLQKRMQ